MKEISLKNWIKEGHGFTADSYKNKDDENLLLKLFFTSAGLSDAEREFTRAIDVAALGVPTPKVFDLVSVDGQPGILFERIEHKRSFGKLCSEDPDNLPKYAKIFAEQSKFLHKVKCDTTKFPNQKNVMKDLVRDCCLRDEIKTFLNELLDRTEETETCLHGDLQPGNIVTGWCRGVEGRSQNACDDDKAYFIDLGTFAYGNPVFDISELYMCTKVYQNEESNQSMLHMTEKQLTEFWKYYAACYLGSDDPVKLQEFENFVAPYAMFFMALIIKVAEGYEPSTSIALAHIEELYERYKGSFK